MIRSKLSIFGFYMALLVMCGCSTTNHGILPSQAYHDITSHYNAYFNANEKLKNTLRVQQDSHKDKFDSVIAVYDYSDPKDFTANAGDLDDAVKRSTLSIQLHGTSNWSDDNMLLIGKSSYLKGDYDKASSSFKYITTEYKDGVDYVKVRKSLGKRVGSYVKAKKKKKKPQVKVVVKEDGTKALEKVDNRPKKNILVHTPARSEALVWLIKTYTRQKKFDKAGAVVTYVRGDDNFYKNYDSDLDLADADLQVSKKDYNTAITPLEKYLTYKKIKKNKKKRVRPLFVLAQCYEQIGNYAKATEKYKAVLKSNPNYDMEFYAKIKMAKLGRKASNDNTSIRNLLTKMGRDSKYKDYWDQIFYELALISVSENDGIAARKFLRKSIDKSVANDDQKALSYLKFAELEYDGEKYVSAKYYYDSTLTFLAKNDTRYPEIEERDKMLDNLVKQLNIIAEEDSLQTLAAMPELERLAYVKTALQKIEEEELNKKAEEESTKQQQSSGNNRQQNSSASLAQTNPQASNSTWYFYNAAARATGYNNFIQKWGRRKLEENWRRKNKSTTTDDENLALEDTSKIADPKSDEIANAKTPEDKMLAGLPTSPEKLKASTNRMVDAYFTAGTIYKDGLENYPKAKDMFETLNKRFDNHKLLLESLYYLYLIAQKQGNTAQAETYKNLIISRFPDSVIAKILKDPYFVNSTKKKELELNNYYESAYNDYSSNRLDSAWYKCKMNGVAFKDNLLTSKFDLLLALVLAKQNKLEEYVQSLQKISNNSKDTEVKNTASNLLSLLNKSALPQIDLSKDTARRDSMNSLFSPKPDSSANALIEQLNKVKQQAKDKGAVVVVDTSAKKQTALEAIINEPIDTTSNTTPQQTNNVINPTPQEDTTSVYTRSESATHYCVIYIKDPDVTSNIMTSTLAKIQAFNSTQFESSRLQTKQVIINSENKLLNVRQFKTGADAMDYYKVLKNQTQLFDELKKDQYTITVISTVNFGTLLSEKDIIDYQKFFRRVYQ